MAQQVELGDDEEPDIRADALLRETRDTAQSTFRDLWIGFVANLPRFAVALTVLFIAWLMVRAGKFVLRHLLRRYQQSNAAAAIYGIVVWSLAAGVAVSVVAGDVRALIGSFGLIGLALSWSLQTPIESFSGWLMNSFKGYYRVGDRVAVGDIVGDVVAIDFLTTTVWEIGTPERGFVRAEQPTGRMITFPNNEVLAGSVVNYTRDFPFVWDELAVAIANESDLIYARDTIQKVADEVLADYMEEPARAYAQILSNAGFEVAISDRPEIFIHTPDSWTDIVIRYLVDARQRRIWKSRLSEKVSIELADEKHHGKIIPAYERRQIQVIGSDGAPRNLDRSGEEEASC